MYKKRLDIRLPTGADMPYNTTNPKLNYINETK